jgi:hypothetical protein
MQKLCHKHFASKKLHVQRLFNHFFSLITKQLLLIINHCLDTDIDDTWKMTCKGICISHKASGRYATGHKRCQICDLFVQWDGVFCPCCGSRLRVGPRNTTNKAKLRKKTKKI